MTIRKKDIHCPTCNKIGTWTPENPFKPFCSERCKLIDLGDWAAEKHRVAGEKIDPHAKSSEDEE